MYKIIVDLIERYDTIIVHRHKNPDGDAMGSQLGLKRLIELNYPEKTVYAVGDENIYNFLGHTDDIKDDIFKGALSIVVDVSVSYLVSDTKYELADHVLVIDHHLNPSDIADTDYINPNHIACAEIIADVARANNWEMDEQAATCLLTGITTDSGRYLYPITSEDTFLMAAYLLSHGAKIQWIYDMLYTEPIENKKLKGYFITSFKLSKNKVAYMKNSKEIATEYGVSTFTVSRAMVNQMSGIEGVEIWANFTEDETGNIICELRSKQYPIVQIARKYGGGGHALACGCTISSFAEVDQVIADLDEVLEMRDRVE